MKTKPVVLIMAAMVLLQTAILDAQTRRGNRISELPQKHDTLHPKVENKSAPIKFTESQLAKLNEALLIANSSIKDSLFEKLVNDQAGVYAWDYDRLECVQERHRKNPVAFFLSEFRTHGLPTVKQFVAKDGYDNDDITGSTVACTEDINFNVDNLDRPSRTAVYVAGTIVHERAHGFCYKHRSNNPGQEYNLCDIAYHAGHVAIIIALYRANDSKPIDKPSMRICKSLIKRLQDEKIIK